MKISVVVPFYNLEGYVRPCLDSVASAARGVDAGLEVICVDDGSTDGTPAALDGFAAEDPRIRVVHKPNGGEGSARNAGVAAATGDWVTFLDGDDVWLQNHLEVAVPLIRRHPEADIVALKYADFDDGAPPPAPTGSTPSTPVCARRGLRFSSPSPPSTATISRRPAAPKRTSSPTRTLLKPS